MPAKTQREVIDQITEKARLALRKQEDQDVTGLIRAYQRTQNEVQNVVRGIYAEGQWSLQAVRQSTRNSRMMKAVGKQLTLLHTETIQTVQTAAVQQYQDAYTWNAYMLDQATPPTVGISMTAIPTTAVTAIVNTPFEGAMFSQRIGAVTDAMASDIRDELTQSLINGESMDDAAFRVRDVFGAYNLDSPSNYANRADMIARSEIMRASGLARDAIFDQNRDICEDDDEWLATPDDRLCPYCMARDGKTSKEFKPKGDDPNGKKFTTPLHPRCILPGNKVVIPDLEAGSKAFYKGRCIEIGFSDGTFLSVTPNHPIATLDGWMDAKDLRKGINVISARNPKRISFGINPNYNYSPTPIEKIFDSIKMAGGMASRSVKTSPEDFHGDARGFNGNIEVVRTNSFLRGNGQEFFSKPTSQKIFGWIRYFLQLSGKGNFFSMPWPQFFTSDSIMSRFGKVKPLNSTGSFHSFKHPLRTISGFNASSKQAYSETSASESALLRKFLFAFSGDITQKKVTKIRNFDFSGHVYDLQAGVYSLYICNSIIVKNCRCTLIPRLKSWKSLLGYDMPEGYGPDVRGMRDEVTGRWSIMPVQSFQDWKAQRMGAL
jgi:Phage Mu protein F like protein